MVLRVEIKVANDLTGQIFYADIPLGSAWAVAEEAVKLAMSHVNTGKVKRVLVELNAR